MRVIVYSLNANNNNNNYSFHYINAFNAIAAVKTVDYYYYHNYYISPPLLLLAYSRSIVQLFNVHFFLILHFVSFFLFNK